MVHASIPYECSFISMPQPLADASSHSAAMSTHSSDHRIASDGGPPAEAIEQLTNAVASIPSYVERCAMLWAFVPPVPHSDLPDGAICNFHSWSRRGWCRMYARPPQAHPMRPVRPARHASSSFAFPPLPAPSLCVPSPRVPSRRTEVAASRFARRYTTGN